jgi:uncharacterized membrane protein
MSLSIGKRRTDYLLTLLVHDNLALQSVLFLLPRVKVLLLFFGLSIGVSVALIWHYQENKMTSKIQFNFGPYQKLINV